VTPAGEEQFRPRWPHDELVDELLDEADLATQADDRAALALHAIALILRDRFSEPIP
jgi:hypothetical protein